MAILATRPTATRQPQKRHVPIGATIIIILRYTLLTILALIFLIPFYLIVRNGLSTDLAITSPHWNFFPSTLHFENISELFNDPDVPFLDGIENSALISILQTV